MPLQYQTILLYIQPSNNIILSSFIYLVASAICQATQIPTWTLEPQQTIRISDQDGPNGMIVSPEFPNPYPIETESTVLITVHNSKISKIKIEFLEFDVDNTNLCAGDVLELKELSSLFTQTDEPDSPNNYVSVERLLLALCGSERPRPFVVTIKTLMIKFITDAFSEQRKGFKIRYEFIEDENYNGCQANEFRCKNRKCIDVKLLCNTNDDCGDGTDEDEMTPCLNTPTIPYPRDYKCGLAQQNNRTKSRIHPRVIGGQLASILSWPSQVSFQILQIEPVAYVCGGTLIHPMFVISAAHCFSSSLTYRHYRLVFGTNNFSPDQILIRYPKAIHLYPGLQVLQDVSKPEAKVHDFQNDLALIQLNAPVVMSSNVWPACLPHIDEPLGAGRKCVATGWGSTRGSGGSGRLKQVDQFIEHSRFCSVNIKPSSGQLNIADRTMICVKNQLGHGVCNGDSGGPLYCDDLVYSAVPRNAPKKFVSDPLDENENILSKPQMKYTYSDSDSASDDSHYITNNRTIMILDDSTNFHTDNDNDSGKGKDTIQAESTGDKTNEAGKFMFDEEPEVRWTVHGASSSVSDGNMQGGYCALPNVPTLYARISTKVNWILSHMELTRSEWEYSNKKVPLGYIFRSGNPNYGAPSLTDTKIQN